MLKLLAGGGRSPGASGERLPTPATARFRHRSLLRVCEWPVIDLGAEVYKRSLFASFGEPSSWP